MRSLTRVLGAATAAGVLAAVAGCGSSTDSQPAGSADQTAKVTISVSNRPGTDKPADRAAFDRLVTDFQAKNPKITLQPQETEWKADTFQALLAGGQMPVVMDVPFTEMQGLIAREQVADVTDVVSADPLLSQVNPAIAKVASDADGKIFGVPIAAYSMGLMYNRALFSKAGLDPDKPPATWDEVRAAAKTIKDKTGVQGFGSMTTTNTGGWVLTTMTYAFGGRVESEDGKSATVTNDATKKVLDWYSKVRFDDDAFGSNFLLSYDDANAAFAAGKMGMFVQGADLYGNAVVNLGMKKEDFGLAPLPQSTGGLGTLGGGTVSVVNPTATAEQKAAAVKWISFRSFSKYTDQAAAEADAKAAAADGQAVGAPGLPLMSKEVDDQYQGWIKSFVNVPRENFSAYLSTAQSLPLVPEPASKAQEVYATLDPVVQAALTRQDADVTALLTAAEKSAQSAIDAGN